ncbi:four-helix bundle copper-binding protein [Mesobacillus sp.]|uniref:four-helix bundle copper-binding protein n=1 Tax=Mesobacillus sp. TaxID=2675271 RepID=UPI0039EF7363
MGILSASPTQMDNCIDECVKCARACEECLTACLQEPDVQARIMCIQTLNDCAEICLQAVAYMARNSQFAKQHCQLCADICDACAMHCEKFQDAHCQECAKICRECAEACRNMAS